MRATARLFGGLAAAVLTAPVQGCGDDDDQAHSAPVTNAADARAALLGPADLGPGFERRLGDGDDARAGPGVDCLSSAASTFDAVRGDTDVEAEFEKALRGRANGEVSVLSRISSFADPDRAEAALDELWAAVEDCDSAEYEVGEARIELGISLSDEKAVEGLDQQVDLTLDGTVTSGALTMPILVELRYFRVANNTATVSVSMLDAPGRIPEAARIVRRGLDRFLVAVDAQE